MSKYTKAKRLYATMSAITLICLLIIAYVTKMTKESALNAISTNTVVAVSYSLLLAFAISSGFYSLSLFAVWDRNISQKLKNEVTISVAKLSYFLTVLFLLLKNLTPDEFTLLATIAGLFGFVSLAPITRLTKALFVKSINKSVLRDVETNEVENAVEDHYHQQ